MIGPGGAPIYYEAAEDEITASKPDILDYPAWVAIVRSRIVGSPDRSISAPPSPEA